MGLRAGIPAALAVCVLLVTAPRPAPRTPCGPHQRSGAPRPLLRRGLRRALSRGRHRRLRRHRPLRTRLPRRPRRGGGDAHETRARAARGHGAGVACSPAGRKFVRLKVFVRCPGITPKNAHVVVGSSAPRGSRFPARGKRRPDGRSRGAAPRRQCSGQASQPGEHRVAVADPVLRAVLVVLHQQEMVELGRARGTDQLGDALAPRCSRCSPAGSSSCRRCCPTGHQRPHPACAGAGRRAGG